MEETKPQATAPETAPAGEQASVTVEPPKEEATAKKEGTTKKSASKKSTDAPTVLERAGKEAIKRHGYSAVYVTSDGLSFPLESDAKNHAAAIGKGGIVRVTP